MALHMAVCFKKFGIGAWHTRRVIFKALSSNSECFVIMTPLLDAVPDVDIDGYGRFKYILINVTDQANSKSKSIVRGYARAPYHADVFDIASEKLKELSGLSAKCLGGGRIEHDPDQRTLKVYGYSQGYGKADHEVSVAILKKTYPDYEITCSDVGY